MGMTSSAVASALGHGSFAVTAKHYADSDRLHNARVRWVDEALAPGEESDSEPADLLTRLRALPREQFTTLLHRLSEEVRGESAPIAGTPD